MIIDTKKLKESVNQHFEKRSQNIDENIKDDNDAIRLLIRLQIKQEKVEKIIDEVEKLAKQYNI